MTAEPQKEYIITEEQLSQVRTGRMKNPEGKGYGSTHHRMTKWEKKNALNLIRSHPYNAKNAEQVLDLGAFF